MKAVLLNDFKFFKKTGLPTTMVIGILLILSCVITRKIPNRVFIQWALIMVFILREQIVFAGEFNDFEKFITMPISTKDYSLAKIIKNFIVFLFTTILFLIVLIISSKESKGFVLDTYLSIFLALDFLALSLSHIVYSKRTSGLVLILYFLLVIIFGLGTITFVSTRYELLVNYRPIFILGSFIIFVLSFYLDYKFSTKNIREAHII